MRKTLTCQNTPFCRYSNRIKICIFLSLCLLGGSSLLLGQPDFFVANRDGHNILQYTMDGVFVRAFVKARSGGLNSPQEILFHPVDGSMLVTGFNNSNIKRYDGQTGDYLGNFSSGYNLSRPTKMIIGKDSLIYVTQWGSSQNKIVRFDFDGNFVDEWSNINVPEGCGMAWDKEGNLLVTTWSNGQNTGTAGFVRKFDPQGNNLGVLINTTTLQGPVGLWVAENEDIYVIDWTAGAVKIYTKDGQFIRNFISGMTRAEGNALGPDGKYYICDWQLNRVNRYNADGSFDRTLVNQGLNVPNGLAFSPMVVVSADEEVIEQLSKPSIFPNPGTDEVRLNFTVRNGGLTILQVFDILGRPILRKSIQSHSGDNTLPIDVSAFNRGLFYYTLSQGNTVKQSSFSLF